MSTSPVITQLQTGDFLKYATIKQDNILFVSSSLITGSDGFKIHSSSINTQGSITASLGFMGTASYASNANSSSYSHTASYLNGFNQNNYVLNSQTSSMIVLSSSYASSSTSASYSTTLNGLDSNDFLRTTSTSSFSVVNETSTGWIRIGSSTTPANTTAGDLTLSRINIGNGTFDTAGRYSRMSGTHLTAVSGALIGYQFIFAPDVNAASGITNMGMLIDYRISGSVNFSRAQVAIQAFNRYQKVSSSNPTLIGASFEGIRIGTGELHFVNMSGSAIGARIQAVDGFGTNSGSIKEAIGLQILDSLLNVSASVYLLTLTSSSGIEIENHTKGTNNTNFAIGDSTTGNWSIYNSSSYDNFFLGRLSIGSTNIQAAATIVTSASSYIVFRRAAGTIDYYSNEFGVTSIRAGSASYNASLNVSAGSSTVKALSMRAATSQTANIFEWADVSGNVYGNSDGTGSLIVSKSIYQTDIIKPFIIVGGTATARSFTVSFKKFDNKTSDYKRFIGSWWVSTTAYGTPDKPTAQTITFNNGNGTGAINMSGTPNTPTYCVSLSDDSGSFKILSSNAQSGATDTVFLNVEIQGIVYIASGTVNTGAA